MGHLFFAIAMLLLWMGPVTRCLPSVLAPPILLLKGNWHNHEKKDSYVIENTEEIL